MASKRTGTKARLDELELFTPREFFSYTLALVRLFVCLFVCLSVLVLLPKRAAPPNKKLCVVFKSLGSRLQVL